MTVEFAIVTNLLFLAASYTMARYFGDYKYVVPVGYNKNNQYPELIRHL